MQVVDNEVIKLQTFNESEIRSCNILKKSVQSLWRALPYPNNIVIAGGCFVSFFHGETPRDIDVFALQNEEGVPLANIANLYIKIFKMYEQKSQYKYKKNGNILTTYGGGDNNLQLILTKYKTREELVNHFDYAHTMTSYANDKLYITRRTFDAIKLKRLIVNNQNDVTNYRRNKFMGRGFTE